ncbi:MAG: hypothetical protein M3Z30_09465, partial [Gemmatimonadota bacterium]|nr:hypothetical protein [Gemmatimonadota bacterium]
SVDSLSAPPSAHVGTLTGPGPFSEPGVAVDPSDPTHVVAVYQTNAHATYSRDGGATWTHAEATAPHNYKVSGDVSVTFDNRGHAILCYIAFDKLGTPEYWAHNATRNGIFVRRSLDGGKSWEKNAVSVDAIATAPVIPFEDKPYIIADNTHSSFAGNLYIGWTEFTLDKSVILFARSTDGGATWSAPARISTKAGLPRDDNGDVEGFTGAVGADGTLYVAWSDGNSIVFTSSRDGGKTFAKSRPIVSTAPSYFNIPSVDRSNGFPQLGIDPRRQRLFLTWSDYRNGDVDIFSSTSVDAGATWSAALRINDDPIHNGSDQYFQWLAVDPTDGAANVVFYDRRADSTNRAARIFLARSVDGGRTYRNYPWNPVASDAEGAFIGDYTGIAALGGHVYGVWTEKATAAELAEAATRAGHPLARTTLIRVGVADFGRH